MQIRFSTKETDIMQECKHVPRRGDEVKLAEKIYRVSRVIWLQCGTWEAVQVFLDDLDGEANC